MLTDEHFAFLAEKYMDMIFRLAFSYLFATVLGMGVVGYFLASALARLGPVLICGGYFFSGKWKTHKLLVTRAAPASQLEEELDIEEVE